MRSMSLCLTDVFILLFLFAILHVGASTWEGKRLIEPRPGIVNVATPERAITIQLRAVNGRVLYQIDDRTFSSIEEILAGLPTDKPVYLSAGSGVDYQQYERLERALSNGGVDYRRVPLAD